jgi:hypothetical protein
MRFTYGRERSKTARCTTADKSPATRWCGSTPQNREALVSQADFRLDGQPPGRLVPSAIPRLLRSPRED